MTNGKSPYIEFNGKWMADWQQSSTTGKTGSPEHFSQAKQIPVLPLMASGWQIGSRAVLLVKLAAQSILVKPL